MFIQPFCAQLPPHQLPPTPSSRTFLVQPQQLPMLRWLASSNPTIHELLAPHVDLFSTLSFSACKAVSRNGRAARWGLGAESTPQWRIAVSTPMYWSICQATMRRQQTPPSAGLARCRRRRRHRSSCEASSRPRPILLLRLLLFSCAGSGSEACRSAPAESERGG
jgi:hypothetical protein